MMNRRKVRRRSWVRGNTLVMAGGLLCSAFLATAADSDNVRFHGTLVSKPCRLDAGSEDFEVAFGSVIDRTLYGYGRTTGRPLEITLRDCNTAVAKGVKVTFSGAESAALPGLLAVGGGLGVAIGLETPEGQVLRVNEASGLQALSGGDTTIALRAYVQGEPDAVSGRKIVPGDFSVTATFALEYE